MILPDVNILLYALNEQSPFHERAKTWVESALSSTETIGLAWLVLLGVLRTSTSARIFERPLTVNKAFDLIEGWLARPTSLVIHPGPRHHQVLRELLDATGTGGNLVSDAHLAALAIEYDAAIATNDHDFGRFPRVRVIYPLSVG